LNPRRRAVRRRALRRRALRRRSRTRKVQVSRRMATIAVSAIVLVAAVVVLTSYSLWPGSLPWLVCSAGAARMTDPGEMIFAQRKSGLEQQRNGQWR